MGFLLNHSDGIMMGIWDRNIFWLMGIGNKALQYLLWGMCMVHLFSDIGEKWVEVTRNYMVHLFFDIGEKWVEVTRNKIKLAPDKQVASQD